jgi:hypothetical protein
MASHATAVLGRAIRESGQALERLGMNVLEKPLFKEAFSRHRNVANLFDKCVACCLPPPPSNHPTACPSPGSVPALYTSSCSGR